MNARGIVAPLGRSVVAIGLGLVVGAAAIIASGNNPVTVYGVLFDGAFGSYAAFANTLSVATPLMFAALAFSIAAKAGAFNAGIQGQFALATFVTAWLGVKLALPAPLLIMALFAGAMLVGLIWAIIPIVLRVYFGTNELIPTFLLSYVAILIVQYLIVEKFSDPLFNGIANGTPQVKTAAQLPQIMPPYHVTIALPLIVLIAVLAQYILKRMVLGYQLEMTGRSVRFARYGGIPTRRVWIAAMVVSAMLAGASAVQAVAGNEYRAVAGMQPNLFFDAIVVSLMALNNPIGILPAALFVGALENSGIGLQIQTNVSVDLVTVIIGAIILFATVKRAGPAGFLWRWVRTHLFVVVASGSSTAAAETSPPTVSTVEPPVSTVEPPMRVDGD